jgi:hypothetical protein
VNKQDLENQLAELEGRPSDDFADGERLDEKWAAQCWEAFQKSKPAPDPPEALREFWKNPGYRNKLFSPKIRPQ